MQQHLPFTVLKQYDFQCLNHHQSHVATALTVYGIETHVLQIGVENPLGLQQHLPFTVLKLTNNKLIKIRIFKLQQHLPFTVLKLKEVTNFGYAMFFCVATALTVYGIETFLSWNQ
mgnify:CR=1 FL=1